MSPFKYSPVQLENQHGLSFKPPNRLRPKISLCNIFLSIISLAGLLVCGGLVGAKAFKAGLQNPARGTQEIFPNCEQVPSLCFAALMHPC
jgi:hypothetical protein